MTPLEASVGIRGVDLTREEREAIDRIKRATSLLSDRERNGSLSDVVTDLGVAIAAELRRAERDVELRFGCADLEDT